MLTAGRVLAYVQDSCAAPRSAAGSWGPPHVLAAVCRSCQPQRAQGRQGACSYGIPSAASAHVVCHMQLLGQEGSKRQAVGGEHAEEGRTAGSVAARVSFHPLPNCWHFSFLPTESILLIVWA